MRVFVTGATGFVGSAAVRALLGAGHKVTGLVRDRGRAAPLEQLGMRSILGEMLEPESYRAAAAQADVVINAAQYSVSGRLTKRKVVQINHADEVMTTALAQVCLEHGLTLIYTNGCFGYGDHGDAWIDETTPLQPSPMGEGHAKTVTELGRLQAQGLKLVILTAGFVYGPGGLFKTSFYDTLEKGQLRVFGSGQNYWSVVHIDDLAQAFVSSLSAPHDTYNIVDDAPLRLCELVDTLTSAAGRARVGTVPPWLLGLLIGPPVVASLTTSFRVSNTKAKAELGWKPRYPSFGAGLPGVLKELRHPNLLEKA
ncbi:MAG: hypothetical protein AVDCRST_MAG86-2799 [uncultured Truepera sp.]|uniref:NAD-dependent epimerase/dehydratase domain-containing protein n=1 Tax=uncultured Truepera sp. TaxID=543023 RepID=A0A6J4VKX2_9DEIN|nr:MAG: hypothetical protein AVDCRST_MAG86-2799 [uncultured Truepera sp.]